MTAPRLTADEFAALRPKLGRLAVDTIDVARLVLVDGLPPSEAGARYGMSRQRVYGIEQRFKAAMETMPTRWRKVEVWLPPELAAQVEAMATAALAELRTSRQQDRNEA